MSALSRRAPGTSGGQRMEHSSVRILWTRICLGLATAMVVQGVAFGQAIPSGPEFVVNSYTTGTQSAPDVALDANGDFVVVWQSSQQDGPIGGGVFGQGYDGGGGPLGGEFQINTYTTQNQSTAQVASEDNGDFVVTWTSAFQDGSSNGVFAQRFDSAGSPLGAEFLINTNTASNQNNSRVAMDADGDFVVVWQSVFQDGSSGGLFGQRFDSSGFPAGSEFQVNTYTTGQQSTPAVAMDADGNFVVVWSSPQDGSSGGLIGQLFDVDGVPLGGEFAVNTYTTGNQGEPAVAMDKDGDFVVTWTDTQTAPFPAPPDREVFGQRFDSAGAKLGGEFQVNTTMTYGQFNSDVAMEPNGQFVVVWQSETPGPFFPFAPFFADVYAQQFSSSGSPIGTESLVNTNTTFFQNDPSVSVDDVGNFVVSWVDSGFTIFVPPPPFPPPPPVTVPGLDGDGSGIVARLFELPPRVLKREAGEALAEVLPTGDSDVDEALEEAIDHIEASLVDELWLDDQRLSAEGEDAFREEKKAAEELLELVEFEDDDSDSGSDSDSDSDSGALSPEVEHAVVLALGNLAVADERLASSALDEASAAADAAGCPVDTGDGDSDSDSGSDSDSDSDSDSGCDCAKARDEIARGEADFARAVDDVADGKVDQAIDRFRKAWVHAQKALEALVICPVS